MVSITILDPGSFTPLPQEVGGRGLWRVREPVRVLFGAAEIHVPAGFLTDGASTPWWARWRFDPWGRAGVPSVVHDYLRGTDMPRWQADLIFLGLLRAYDVPAWQAHLMHLVVQVWRPKRPLLPATA